ncbi:putative O-methylsterigmatocystin oxidoreductase [Xylariaceae sp. FL1019]|nr:putative O-methylsterigmatocystin oxidoreductase [Xylariaceae sp. FL1019]
MTDYLTVVLLGCFLVAIVYCGFLSRVLNRRLPLPPGPPGHFLLGHYDTVPTDAPFKYYAQVGKEYDSDVVYFETCGTKWIVLNSLNAAVDLLDKRGYIYSDRPRFVMNQLMGWGATLTWLRWSPKMLMHRRVLSQPFTKSKVRQFQPIQRREAINAVTSMISEPEQWQKAVRRFTVAIVLSISYGIDLHAKDDTYIKIADDAAEATRNVGPPASSILDRIPITRHFPSWLPFMERLRYAEKWRWAIANITNIPFEEASRNAENGAYRPCFVNERLAVYNDNEQKGLPNEFDLHDIKGAAATLYIAGNDTTATTITLFILYMMQNRRVLLKAQEEIDQVVGTSRLPDWRDLPRLEYLNLILEEIYRSSPISPLGVPHASTKDDVYRGMFIPKGTIVYQNVWAMTHDETVYSRPFDFYPERYLSVSEGGNGEPRPIGNFGFGRRICIGRNLAENSLMMIFAMIVATLDINWPDSTPYEIEWSYRGITHPKPFKCALTPRSRDSRELLLSESAI